MYENEEFLLAVYHSIVRALESFLNTMGDSPTLAAYVTGIGKLVYGFLVAFHYSRCRCWQARMIAGLEAVELN